MIKKTLLITRESSLSLKNQQLRMSFCDDGTERSIPIEDIGYVVLESHRITISAPLLSALSENNVCVIVTDRNMMPISMLQTLDGNSIQQEIYRNQLAASAPLMKGLWKQVVSSKIGNQARLLEKLGKDGFSMMQYSVYVRNCASKENLEVHEHRIRALLPDAGNVSMLSITDKQFGDMRTYYGKIEKAKLDTPQQLELF